VLNHLKQNPPKGQTAILVRTNRDAHIFHGLLNQHGIRNSLIRSDKGFRLSSLMEIRLLKEMLFGSGNEQIVRQEEWERRKKRAEQVLSTSPLFSFCKSVVETFERISIRNFHLSDWEDLTAESRLSDFSEKDGANIHVSTMHGSKGREFDSVYFVYPGKIPAIDEEIRLFYVALTRAKSELRLFVTFSWNYPVSVPGARELLHDEIFPFPDRLGFQLGMKDVWLDQFIDNQEILKNMEGGARLKFIDASAYDRKGNRILMLSKSFKSELANYQKDGFQLTEGKATYRVFWRKQNHTDSASYDDILIVLPEIELRRESLIPAK
jgi:ATP-dependent DNA helicase RecQ